MDEYTRAVFAKVGPKWRKKLLHIYWSTIRHHANRRKKTLLKRYRRQRGLKVSEQ